MRLNDEMRRELDERLKTIATEQGEDDASASGLPFRDVLLFVGIVLGSILAAYLL